MPELDPFQRIQALLDTWKDGRLYTSSLVGGIQEILNENDLAKVGSTTNYGDNNEH
jgi:hypothetical protein